jgi:hypothetical protein
MAKTAEELRQTQAYKEASNHPCKKTLGEKADEAFEKIQTLLHRLEQKKNDIDVAIGKYNNAREEMVGFKVSELKNSYVEMVDALNAHFNDPNAPENKIDIILAGRATVDKIGHYQEKFREQTTHIAKRFATKYPSRAPDYKPAIAPKANADAFVYLKQAKLAAEGIEFDMETMATATEAEQEPSAADSLAGISQEIIDLVDEVQAEQEDCAHQIADYWGSMWDAGRVLAGDMSQKEFDESEAAKALGSIELAEALPSELLDEYGMSPQFKEQCFLLSQISEITRHKKLTLEANHPKALPYVEGSSIFGSVNACLMADGDPYGFLNRLIQHPNQSAFFDMKTSDISLLQPMIKLYKIKINERGEEEQQRIVFDSYASRHDVETLFQNKKKRGFGVGIREFAFTYDGNNPFAAKKSISAKLTIFANTFSELLEDYRGFRYVDLALKTGGSKKIREGQEDATNEVGEEPQCSTAEERDDNLAQLDFRIKAVVGWAIPTGNKETLSRGVLGALQDSYVTLNLTPTIHEFKFDQQGRVNFTINYLAYVEDFFDQPNFNIFANSQINKKIIERQLKYKNWKKTDDCGATKISEDKKKLAANGTILNEKRASLKSLLDKMIKTNKIYFINLSLNDIKRYKSEGPYFTQKGPVKVSENKDDAAEVGAAIGTALDDSMDTTTAKDNEAMQLALSQNINSFREQNIGFFYVSDLLDVILASIDKGLQEMPELIMEIKEDGAASESAKWKAFYTQFKKFRVLLGPLEIRTPKETSDFVNFGDIPVSVKYFTEWMTEKLLKKDQVVYPLPKFLNDFFNNLVRNFLNDDNCFTFSTKQKTRLNQAVVTSYKKGELDEFTTRIRKIAGQGTKKRLSRLPLLPGGMDASGDPPPILNTSGVARLPVSDSGVQQEVNYLIFFAGRTQPVEKMKGIKSIDEDRGIFHYMLGKPTGIVKTIDLEKSDTTGLKELRFEKQGFQGLEQLREVYDVTIKTYANVSTFPGTYIFVDPRGFAPDLTIMDGEVTDLTRYGIGGYHMITRSEHRFGPGIAESTIDAKWVAQIDNEEECAQQRASETNSSDDAAKKCSTQIGQRQEAAWGGELFQKVLGWAGNKVTELMDEIGIPPLDMTGEN